MQQNVSIFLRHHIKYMNLNIAVIKKSQAKRFLKIIAA